MGGGFVTVRLTSRWPFNPASLIVGLASGSHQFSHAIAIIGDYGYQASMPGGCNVGTIEEMMDGVVVYRDMPVWVPNLSAAIAFADDQCAPAAPAVPKKYDWLGAVGIPFTYSESWADESKWWCSELVFAILLAGGTRLFDPAVMKRVRPIDLQMCDYPKEPLTYVKTAFKRV